MFIGYIVDNLGSPGIEETLPKFLTKFRRVKKKKKNIAPYTLYRGRLTDKLIEKLGLLQLVLEHLVGVSGIEILM